MTATIAARVGTSIFCGMRDKLASVVLPIEPAPTRWALPAPQRLVDTEIVGVGADLEPGTLLAAYRTGLFPMRLHADGPLAWWSPDPRGVIPLDGMHVSRSLRRSCRRFELRVDTAFEEVMRGCADPRRPHGWIDEEFIDAYVALHRLGWAHSVEVWRDGATRGWAVRSGDRRAVRRGVEVPSRA